MTRILFLDMDGVLNSTAFFDLLRKEDDLGFPKEGSDDWWCHMVDPVAVDRLNKILEATEAQVVISSSWRYHCTSNDMQRILDKRGLQGKVIGRTPTASQVRGRGICLGQYVVRGHQIHTWILENPELEVENQFVILDDMGPDSFVYLAPHLVRTSRERGLLDEHIEPAIQILRDGPKKDA